MFKFHGTRKPNFTKIKKIDYRDDYWIERGFQIRSKLIEREQIFFDWIQSGSRVADVGCGNSRLLYELRTKKNCTGVAMDISPRVIESLQKEGIDGRVVDLEDPSFTIEGEYDYIIMSELLEHMTQPEELITKLAKHTRYFALSVPNSAFYHYRLGLMFRGRFFTQWMSHPSEHLRFWSHSDFLDWLKAMNLDLVRWEASNGFELKNWWPNMFGHQMCYLVKTKQ